MKTRTILTYAVLLTMVAGLAACGTTKTDRAVSGGAIGAGVGAVGTAVMGGNPITGAVVGAGVGAATGALTNKKQINLEK